MSTHSQTQQTAPEVLVNENTEATGGEAGTATNHSNREAEADANEVTASPKEIAAALSNKKIEPMIHTNCASHIHRIC